MKIISIFFISLLITNTSLSNDLFQTSEYELNFFSNNITNQKDESINKIKTKSFKIILEKILTNNNYKKIERDINLSFVNKFILNIKVENEKIINNSYYSKIKINFNKNLIIDYFIEKEISYIDHSPEKFLLVIYDENDFGKNFLSKNNVYYKFIRNNKNVKFNDIFTLPNLDFNDRYIINQNDLGSDYLNKINLLGNKYNSKYKIFIHSKNFNNINNIFIYLISNDIQILIGEKKIDNINYKELLINSHYLAVDKWKHLNQIDTSILNILDCKININNINELKFVRNILLNNRIIKKFDLKSIMYNENIYNITYYGNFDVFKRSLESYRLKLFKFNDQCFIKLI